MNMCQESFQIPFLVNSAYLSVSRIHYSMGAYELALKFNQKALKNYHLKFEGYQFLLVDTLAEMGRTYHAMSQFKEAQ